MGAAIALIAAFVLVAVAGATAVDGDPSSFQVQVEEKDGGTPIMVFSAPSGEMFIGTYTVSVMKLDGMEQVYQITTSSTLEQSSFFIEFEGLDESTPYYITFVSSGGQSMSAIYSPMDPKVTLSMGAATDSGSIDDGKSENISVNATPEGLLDVVDEGSIEWSSSKEGIVQISGGTVNGCNVEALKPGMTTITVKFTVAGVEYSGSYELTVNRVGVSSVVISSEDNIAEVDPEKTLNLTATVNPSNATNPEVTWDSYDDKIATVDQDGTVTGVSPGTTTIKATADGVSGTFTVTVNPIPVESISIGGDRTLDLNKQAEIECIFTPANATNQNVTWESDHSDVVTVDEGVIKAVGIGEAIITVTSEDGSKTASIKVTVSAVPVEGISIVDAPQTMNVGDNYELGYTITPSDASTQDVVWTSSDSDVLSVSSQGMVTALKASDGSVKIIVSITDEYGQKQTFSDEVEIVVVPADVPTYRISVEFGEGGSVTPSGDVNGNITVLEGEDLRLVVTVSDGYRLSSVTVDWVEVDLIDGAYTFENVTSNHKFNVTFEYVGSEDPDDPGVIIPPIDDDDDYVPIPPVIDNSGSDDDTTTIVACAAAAVVAALIAVFLIMEYRKR